MEPQCEEDNELEIIENKHRKERKDLQAQIQALKKVVKNDKTKKKELTAEIARLEIELDNRHKKEIESATKVISFETNTELISENEETKMKLSKAHKRRVKKEHLEREREKEIKLQEKENINGPRNVENNTIYHRLKELNLKVYLIPSDGDCLYKAISHQLLIKKKRVLSVQDLRKCTSIFIRENRDDFLPFMSHPETSDMLTEDEFDEYCNKIVNSKVWGGQIEIRALSNYLECPISIVQANGPSLIQQGEEFEEPSLIITYHRHMYSLGEHYNSTEGLEDKDADV